MSYSIVIGTADRTTLLIAGTLSYTLQSNHDDTASCALLTTAAGFIPAVGQSFYVYESVDAENKFGGVINSVTIEKLEAGVSTSKALRVEMTVSPFNAIASRRTVAYSETAVTAKTIVQKVISALSTDGITEGTVNTGASDIGEYDAPLNTCSQVMDDMCTASGYQWWIDPDKLLHFYNFDLVISAPYTVTETGNYTVDSYSYDIDQYANKIFVQGHPDVSAVITRQDTAEQTARSAIEGGSGIYGATIIDENIVTEADANAAGDAALKWAGIIPQKLVFTAYDNLSSWYPGYRVTANLPSIGLTANTSFNIDSVMTSDQGTYFQSQVNCSVRKSDSFSNAQAQTGIEYLGKLVNGVSSGVSSGVSINETTGAITPVVKGVVQVWVATALSTLAKNNDVFVDTDDYSRYDMTAYSTTGTLTSASGEFIELTGTAACTLTITSPGTAAGTCTKYIKNSSSQSWTIGATIDGTANYTLAANLGVSLYWNSTDWRAFAGGGGAGGGQTASFTSIIVSGQSTILATTAAATLEFVAGTNVTITTNTSNKTVTFASSGGGQTAVFSSILVSGQSTILATTAAGTLEFVQGSGMTITTNTSNKTVTFNATVSAFATVAQTMYIGTTAHAINRSSAAEGLSGITSLVPGADFTLAQNSVNVLTSENTGAIANTLYLKAGKVGIGMTAPGATLDILGATPNFAGRFRIDQSATDWVNTYSTFNMANADATVGNNALFSFSDNTGADTSAGIGAKFIDRTNRYGDLYFYTKGTDGYNQRLYIQASGNVGIGTTAPAGLLDVYGAGSTYAYLGGNTSNYRTVKIGNDANGYAVIQGWNKGDSTIKDISLQIAGGNVGIGLVAPSSVLDVVGTVQFASFGAGAATFDASGNISSVSDERMKNIQGNFTAGLKEVLQINPILYKYNELSGLEMENTYAGFSAQNVMKYIPEAVGKNLEGYYSFNDRPVLAAAINAIKELQTEIVELRKQLNLPIKNLSVIALQNEERCVISKVEILPEKIVETPVEELIVK